MSDPLIRTRLLVGDEAVRRLEVENLPLTVVIDSQGNNLYETGRAAYLEQRR